MGTTRTNGLDTLRALAIALVFLYHYSVFTSQEPGLGWVGNVGWVGVDLFFVLSGYLIANQLFAGLANGERLSVGSFYARRALRTWPAYWVMLALYFSLPAVLEGNPPPSLWAFLTFTQNLHLRPGTAFSHAWSLCIEEQFYFVLPLVLLAAHRLGTHRRQAWLLLVALLVLGVCIRCRVWCAHGPDDFGPSGGYHTRIYYASLCRFDEFLPGIAVALLKNFHPVLWRRLMAQGGRLLGAGLIAVSLVLYGFYHHYRVDGTGYPFFMSVFGYSLIAIAFALLLASALSPASFLHGLRIPWVTHLALWSYSIYLSHKAIAHLLKGWADQLSFSPLETLLAIAAASIAGGALLYYTVELPLMKLRDRVFPSTFRAASESTDSIPLTEGMKIAPN